MSEGRKSMWRTKENKRALDGNREQITRETGKGISHPEGKGEGLGLHRGKEEYGTRHY